MITFLFWNLRGNLLEEILKNLVERYDVDVVMLAEMDFAPDVLLSVLNRNQVRYEYAANVGCKKIHIFVRFREEFLEIIRETERLTIRHLKLPNRTSILLAAVHMVSKLHYSEHTQIIEAIKLAEEITKAEKDVDHTRTVLVGDLNMDPFDDGVVTTSGFHGVMSRDTAKRKSRVVQGTTYHFFYNPMWNLLGDRIGKPIGTYYYSNGEHIDYFWHIFDQVLIRPSLIDLFEVSNLEILTTDGKISFLTSNGLPDKQKVSDHLPIKFTLDLQQR